MIHNRQWHVQDNNVQIYSTTCIGCDAFKKVICIECLCFVRAKIMLCKHVIYYTYPSRNPLLYLKFLRDKIENSL